ncbi:MAG: hypothetical protein DRP66_09990 [Planctomycetota bacterium]|nr:MAG: hypothetical protein DRP66_09990 [Planctomycetota bacterium]
MSRRAVIFDLDGTLVDTLEDLTAAINAALGHLSLPTHSAQACKMMIGNGAAWGFRGRGELEAAGAHIIIDSPRELLDCRLDIL